MSEDGSPRGLKLIPGLRHLASHPKNANHQSHTILIKHASSAAAPSQQLLFGVCGFPRSVRNCHDLERASNFKTNGKNQNLKNKTAEGLQVLTTHINKDDRSCNSSHCLHHPLSAPPLLRPQPQTLESLVRPGGPFVQPHPRPSPPLSRPTLLPPTPLSRPGASSDKLFFFVVCRSLVPSAAVRAAARSATTPP